MRMKKVWKRASSSSDWPEPSEQTHVIGRSTFVFGYRVQYLVYLWKAREYTTVFIVDLSGFFLTSTPTWKHPQVVKKRISVEFSLCIVRIDTIVSDRHSCVGSPSLCCYTTSLQYITSPTLVSPHLYTPHFCIRTSSIKGIQYLYAIHRIKYS